jgi:hypothetical protein
MEHVTYQTANPQEKVAKHITNPGKLSRTQQLDLCALCHGGRLAKTKPSFSFQTGDKLSDYFEIDTIAKDAKDIDVHGNQFGLLAASKCFKMSDMTCSSCHSSHENEAGMTALFSQRCMNCHTEAKNNFCGLHKKLGDVIKQNCIDCHMPMQASKAIVFLRQGDETPSTAFMRNHHITIYPNETKRMLNFIKTNKK